MRYVVTGSAGFIGHHVCAMLLRSGNEVDGVDSFTDYYDPSLKRANDLSLRRHARYRCHELDLGTAPLECVLDGADAVIHLAGQPGVRFSWADGFRSYVDRNLTATQRLLEAARRTRVARLVLASSSSVYGNASTYPTSEDSPTRPVSPYGVTKLAMEHLARAYGESWGLPAVVLRYFTVYGPRQRPDMALYRFIAAAARGRPVPIYGDGEQVRDFTYVSDAVAATIAAATGDVPPASVLNVAGGSCCTVNEVVRLVAESVGYEVATRRLAEQPGDVRMTGGAIDRARRVLHWEPGMPLKQGISRQVSFQLPGDDRSARGRVRARAPDGKRVPNRTRPWTVRSGA